MRLYLLDAERSVNANGTRRGCWRRRPAKLNVVTKQGVAGANAGIIVHPIPAGLASSRLQYGQQGVRPVADKAVDDEWLAGNARFDRRQLARYDAGREKPHAFAVEQDANDGV